MAFSHRDLEENDVDMICEFVQSAEELFFAFPQTTYPLTPDDILAVARQRFSPTVVLAGETVVGYANFIKTKKNGFCAIGNLMVHPAHRRKGVATYLVKVMMCKAFENYCARIVRCACFSHNQAAYQLYHNLGFRPAGMELVKTTDGAPVLLVNLYLQRQKLGCNKDM